MKMTSQFIPINKSRKFCHLELTIKNSKSSGSSQEFIKNLSKEKFYA